MHQDLLPKECSTDPTMPIVSTALDDRKKVAEVLVVVEAAMMEKGYDKWFVVSATQDTGTLLTGSLLSKIYILD